jgi:hypothetical protein
MPAVIKHVHVPASAGEWHHFIVTRPDAHTVRVAYQRTNAEGDQLSTRVDALVENAASWNLPPDAHAAFRAQLAAGWRGEVTSDRAGVHRTRFEPLGYQHVARGLWRCVDLETGAHVGPQYRTKAELLADLPRYARDNWSL